MRRLTFRILLIFVACAFLLEGKCEGFEDVFPEPPATLEIRPAVEIAFQTEKRFGYVVQTSSDLTTWTDLPGSVVIGSGEPVSRLFKAAAGKKTFYRLQRIQVMYQLPNLSCGTAGILMWHTGSTVTNLLTFPQPGEFVLHGIDRGTIGEIDRDHNTLRFVAQAEMLDAYTPYFDGEVFLKFETETNGLFVIKNSFSGDTFSGSFLTVPHDPVEGPPPTIENGLLNKTLELTYCPNGWERFEFRSATEVLYVVFGSEGSLGDYTYDPSTGELVLNFQPAAEYRIKLGNAIASVTYRESLLAPWQTDHATYRIFSR